MVYTRKPVRRHVTRPEQALQIGVVKVLAQIEALTGGEDFFFFHPANGGYRTKAEAAIMKAMGVRAGVSDMFFLFPQSFLLGCVGEVMPPMLIIEYKAGKGDLTEDQEAFGLRMEKFGIPWYVVTAQDIPDATVKTLNILHRHLRPGCRAQKVLESWTFPGGRKIGKA